MNPYLPRSSFYPFKTLIRPMQPPPWCKSGTSAGAPTGSSWGDDREAVDGFLDDLCREPLTRKLSSFPPFRCLSEGAVDRLVEAMRVDGVAPGRLTFSDLAVVIMRYVARELPFRCHDPVLDPVLNLRAVFHVGGVVARDFADERCRECPRSGARCGGGVFCARFMVEDFIDRRTALRDPAKAELQLADMAAWSDGDYRRFINLTALSPAACGRYERTRAVC